MSAKTNEGLTQSNQVDLVPIQAVNDVHAVGHLKSKKPFVIWDEHPRRGRLVIAACDRSREFGVVPEMPVSQAVELLRQGLRAVKSRSLNRKGTRGRRSALSPESVHSAPFNEKVLADGLPESSSDAALPTSAIENRSIQIHSSNQKFHLCQRDVTGDDYVLGCIANLIQQQITPVVAVETLDDKQWAGVDRHQREGLICDVSGVAHLYGGEVGLCHATERLLGQLGLFCRLVVADTVAAAWGFARFGWMNPTSSVSVVSGYVGCQRRGDLPVEALRIFPEVNKNLKRLGIQRLDQLFALPRSGLVSRLGQHLVLQMTRMMGERDEPLMVYRPPIENHFGLELEYPTRDLLLLQDRVHRLVVQLCAKLLENQQGVLRLVLKLELVDHPACSFEVGLFAPTVDVQQVTGLINQKLEVTSLSGLVKKMELVTSLTGPLRTVQADLFSETQLNSWAEGVNDSELNRFINVLTGRFGKDSVVALSQSRNPLPEKAFKVIKLADMQNQKSRRQFRPAAGNSNPRKRLLHSSSLDDQQGHGPPARRVDTATGKLIEEPERLQSHASSGEVTTKYNRPPSPDDPMRRPSCLLARPLRLRVSDSTGVFRSKVEARWVPTQVQLAGQVYSILCSWGPERIETGWWKGPSIRRDYYRVELNDGQWWWIFRSFPPAESNDRRSSWMLHGYFD